MPDKKCFFDSLKIVLFLIKNIKEQLIFGILLILGEYHDLYLKTDVLLLCDVFEKFINVCLMDYGLDPCHYYSSPGLSWDAILKMTGVKLETN